jgi:hypothetical protein
LSTTCRTHVPLLLVSLLLMGATCQQRVEAPRPVTPLVAPEPPPLSRIDTFIRIPLAELQSQADAVVPRTFRVPAYEMVLEGTAEDPVVSAGYEVTRDALTLVHENGRLFLRTTLAYSAQARRHVGPAYVSGSCGTDGESPRHFRLAVAISARVTGTWILEPRLALHELTPTDRCEMTFAGVDVTPRVRAALIAQLETELPALRDRIRAQVDLRNRATEAWNELAAPVALDAETFLALHPEAVSVTQPTVEGHFLRVGLGLRARPEISVGARPVITPPPLPDAGSTVEAPSITLHVPMRIPYEAIEREVRESLRLDSGGIRYPATGRRFVRPTHVTLYGYGASVVVRVELTGTADIVLYMTGRPVLDEATQRLTLAELEYTVESRSLLVNMAAYLRADELRDALQERLRFDLRAPLEETRVRLSQALRRRMGALELEGAIDTLRVAAVYIDPEDRTMHAVVNATGVIRGHYIGE